MDTLFILLSILCFFLFVVLLVVFLIQKLRKRAAKKLKIAWLSSILATVVFFVAFLVVAMIPSKASEVTPTEVTIQTEVGFDVVDSGEPLEIEYYTELTMSDKTLVYDADYLYLIFGDETVTSNDLHEAIDDNALVSEDFKPYFHEYVDLYTAAYPDADLRILYHNLLSIEVVEYEDEWDLAWETLSTDAYACYVQPENTIYVLTEYDYIKGTWEYQVLMHEISHAARMCVRETEELSYAAVPGLSTLTILNEALNSVFTVGLFDYEERDIAYQLQSNYLLVMLDCMDNYTLSDYINHSQSYFLSKLDEAVGYTNYASVLWDMIDLQREDYLSGLDSSIDRIQIPKEEYYPIYDFLCDMYYSKYITPDMTAEEVTAVVDKLVDIITFDVPEGYELPEDYFYTAAEEWVSLHAD